MKNPAAVKAPPEALQETQNRPESETPHPQGVPLNPHTGGLTGLKVPAAGEVAPLSTAGKSSKTEPHLGLLPTEGLSKSEPHLDIASLKTGESASAPARRRAPVGGLHHSLAGRTQPSGRQGLHGSGARDARSRAGQQPRRRHCKRRHGIHPAACTRGRSCDRLQPENSCGLPADRAALHPGLRQGSLPGFFLADASAFEVTRENLRAVDESGNYLLEITVVNRSNFAQAVPSLEIILVDEADNELMRRRLDPRGLSLGPDRHRKPRTRPLDERALQPSDQRHAHALRRDAGVSGKRRRDVIDPIESIDTDNKNFTKEFHP